MRARLATLGTVIGLAALIIGGMSGIWFQEILR